MFCKNASGHDFFLKFVKYFINVLTNCKKGCILYRKDCIFATKIPLGGKQEYTMKKIISFLLATVLVVGVMFSMVSCSGDIEDGTYKCANGTSVEVDGSKIIMTAGENAVKFKYEIDDKTGELVFHFHSTENEALETYYEGLDESQKETRLPFEFIDGGFKLDGKEYIKQ